MWIRTKGSENTADIGALESVCNLDAEESKAQVNKLSKA
jgi:hypothetical protein